MKITFEGQDSRIDANTLINALIHYNTIISVANSEYGGGSRNISVKVNAPEKGSFVIDLSLTEGISSLFSSESVLYIASLVTITGGVFSAYKHFRGKPAEDGTEIIKTEIKGNRNLINQTIIKIYNQPLVREAISKSIETANEDASVEGIRIDGMDIPAVKFERSEFGSLIYTDFDRENIRNEKAEIINNATLTITKLSFERGGQWQFLFNGFKISMVVKDDALMEIIEKGARFGKGDAIKVDLQINQRYNRELRGYENKSYRILSFLEHILAPVQTDWTTGENADEHG